MRRFSPPTSPRSRSRAATAAGLSSGSNSNGNTMSYGASSSTSTSPVLRVTTASGSTSTPSPHSYFARSKSSNAMGDMLGRAYEAGSSNTASLMTGDMSDGRSSSSSGTLGGLSSLSTKNSQKRGRSSSILSIHEIKENYDDALDQSAMSNLNADWVNYKGTCCFFLFLKPFGVRLCRLAGAWLIHIVLVGVGKILVDSIPGIEQDTSWTIVFQGYLLVGPFSSL